MYSILSFNLKWLKKSGYKKFDRFKKKQMNHDNHCNFIAQIRNHDLFAWFHCFYSFKSFHLICSFDSFHLKGKRVNVYSTTLRWARLLQVKTNPNWTCLQLAKAKALLTQISNDLIWFSVSHEFSQINQSISNST